MPVDLESPITELNNHSLREFFEDGNLSILNLPYTTNSYYNALYALTSVQPNEKLYVNITSIYNGLNDEISGAFQRLGISDDTLNYLIYGGYKTHKPYDSRVVTYTGDMNSMYIYYYSTSTNAITNTITILGHVLISLNDLGIDTLTVEQMDYYYSLYNYFLTGETPDLTNSTLYDFSIPPTESTVLFAKWTENPPSTYTVSFNSVNGSYVAPTTVLDGGLITRPSDPYKQGYDFVGWSTSINGELFNFTETTVTEDMTLYAVWEVPETPVGTDITDNETFNWFINNWYYLAIGLVLILVIFTPKRKVWKRR
jgi:uncharacterized repeat protein (TIGR02543 family)